MVVKCGVQSSMARYRTSWSIFLSASIRLLSQCLVVNFFDPKKQAKNNQLENLPPHGQMIQPWPFARWFSWKLFQWPRGVHLCRVPQGDLCIAGGALRAMCGRQPGPVDDAWMRNGCDVGRSSKLLVDLG